MNITLLANKDIASNYAINRLLPELSGHSISLFLSSQVGTGGDKPSELQTLKFFEQDLFNELLSTLLPSPGEGKSRFRSFDQLNELLCQPIQELNQINSPEGQALIKAGYPEVIISIRYGVILKDEVIGIPKLGVLNLHSGLLPAYRGVMATFWALLNGESEIGATLHFIDDSRIDTGGIIDSSKMRVDSRRSYLWHLLELYKGGCELIVNAVSAMAEGQPIQSSPQPGEGNYFSFPSSLELDEFNRQGLRLVDGLEMIEFIKKYYC